MARRTQLLQLVAQLRAETGRTQKITVGIDEVDNLKEMLRRVQEQLYDDNDWQHLRVEKSIVLSSGQRYYDMPSGLNFDRIETVKLWRNGDYYDIDRGIKLTDYNDYDSNADTPARCDPAQKWDVRLPEGEDTEQIEIWPIPVTSEQKLYFTGTASLDPLIEESHRAMIDDRLIVLYTAAEILARQGAKDAQAKLEQAKARFLTLKRNSVKASPTIQMGLGTTDRRRSYGTTITVSS